MAGGRKRKRGHGGAEVVDETSQNIVNAGATLSRLSDTARSNANLNEEASGSGEWETVKSHKKAKYPHVSYSELHLQDSVVKLGDLQNVVLYCLADGVAPQWISIKHHEMVNNAVVLFVPGLEKGMFDGKLDIRKEEEAYTTAQHIEERVQSNPNGEISVIDPAAYVANNFHPNRFEKLHVQSPDDYLPLKLSASALPECLKPLAGPFSHIWPVKAPGDDKHNKVHSPLQAMLQSPITRSQEDQKRDRQIKGPKPPRSAPGWEDCRTPITTFLASTEELVENDYVLHPTLWSEAGRDTALALQTRIDKGQSVNDGWADSRVNGSGQPSSAIEDGAISAGRTIYALDCEMCRVKGGVSALTRISLTGWDGKVVMDEFVQPDLPIIDYLTPYSGITPEKLQGVTTTLADIQARLLDLLTPDSIVLGHSLDSDFTALKLTHPFIIDTSLLYPHPRGPPMKSSLKWLAQKYLSREIQKGHGATGHDSIEDARACLDLVKMKCEKGPKWGTQEATVEPIFKRLKRAPMKPMNHGTAVHGSASEGKTGAIVDHGNPERNFGQMADYCIPCATDQDVAMGVQRAINGDVDGKHIPRGGVNFVWARLRDLDIARGWRGDNRHAAPSSDRTNGSVSTSTDAQDLQGGHIVTPLSTTLSTTVSHIRQIHASLPPCTLFIVYSGTGDPREMARLQEQHRRFKREYETKKWDQIHDKWTDREEQALKAAVKKAREGVGLVCIT